MSYTFTSIEPIRAVYLISQNNIDLGYKGMLSLGENWGYIAKQRNDGHYVCKFDNIDKERLIYNTPYKNARVNGVDCRVYGNRDDIDKYLKINI